MSLVGLALGNCIVLLAHWRPCDRVKKPTIDSQGPLVRATNVTKCKLTQETTWTL